MPFWRSVIRSGTEEVNSTKGEAYGLALGEIDIEATALRIAQ